MHARQLEIAKYPVAYADPAYAMGRRRRDAVQALLQSWRPGSLLDVGTGRGETLLYAAQAGHDARGTEVVPALIHRNVVYAEAHELPFDDASIDYVTCFDVLEHLIAADIAQALTEIKRVARLTCVVTAADFPHIFRGMDLHVSRRPIPEWDALIRGVWGPSTVALGKLGISPAWRLDKHV